MKNKIIVLPATLLLSLTLLSGNSIAAYAAESNTATGTPVTSENPDDYAEIYDPQLISALNQVLGQPSDSKIKIGQLQKLTTLNLQNKNLGSVYGLQYCTNLVKLNVSHNNIYDYRPLANLKKIENLDISYNFNASYSKEVRYHDGCVDVQDLSNLENLKVLNAKSSAIGSADFLYNMKKLESVDLSDNFITSIYSLFDVVKLDSLKTLDISDQYMAIEETKKITNGNITVSPNVWLPSNSKSRVSISKVSFGEYSTENRAITINANEFFKGSDHNIVSYNFADPDKYEGKNFKFDGVIEHLIYRDNSSNQTQTTNKPSNTAKNSKVDKKASTDKKTKGTAKTAKTDDNTNILYYLGIAGFSLGATILAKKKFM